MKKLTGYKTADLSGEMKILTFLTGLNQLMTLVQSQYGMKTHHFVILHRTPYGAAKLALPSAMSYIRNELMSKAGRMERSLR